MPQMGSKNTSIISGNSMIKRVVKVAFFYPLKLLVNSQKQYLELMKFLFGRERSFYFKMLSDKLTARAHLKISHTDIQGNVVQLNFDASNALSELRGHTFSTKEPETLRWIDERKHLGDLFDIGANVGIYSIYFAKQSKHVAVAFEPSAFNLPSLVKNINLNGLSKKVIVCSTPLFSKNIISEFNLSDDTPANAHNSFAVDYNAEGLMQSWGLSFKTLGFSMDYLIENRILPNVPGLIKLDVDGIEHLILSGAKKTLSNEKCRTVLVEVNEQFEEQKESVERLLRDSGFEMVEASSNAYWSGQSVKNYIWDKLDAPS